MAHIQYEDRDFHSIVKGCSRFIENCIKVLESSSLQQELEHELRS